MILSLLNYISCKVCYSFVRLKGSNIYLSWLKIAKNNSLNLSYVHFLRSRINVQGKDNQLVFDQCLISDSIINVAGENNLIQVAKGVKLRQVNIIIRGKNCTILIDSNTTFGGARIINVGSNNAISIGKECLFSDQIEIWASDSHAIYDENSNWINREKPITIGNNVWIGSRVTILKGVTIADGAIIGMGTLLTKNVKQKTLVAGTNSLKVLKENIHWTLDYPDGK